MSKESRRRARNFQLGIKPKPSKVTEGLIATDAVIAGPAAHPMSSWLADTFNHNFDQYDRAIDAVYNATHIGGSKLHHIVDGQHSILGAFEAVKGVSPDDSWATEVCQAGEHLLRDTMSRSGINPFFSLTPDQYSTIANAAEAVGVSRAYLADALTVNGPELFGGAIALAGSVIVAKKADPSALSTLGGAYLTSAIVSANPLLIPIAAGSLAYAVIESGSVKEVAVEAGKGAFVSGSALLVSSIIGGPAWLGCIAGAMTAIAVKQCVDNPDKAWDRAQELILPAKEAMSQVSRQIRTMTYEPA